MAQPDSKDAMLNRYDEITQRLDEYTRFRKNLVSQARKRMHLMRHLLNFRYLWRIWRDRDFLSERQSDTVRSLIQEVAVDADKNNPFFEVVVSEYPIAELGQYLQREFTDIEFERLAAVHEWKGRELARPPVDVLKVLGLVLAAGALVLNTIPESVITRIGNYATFQLWAFWITIGVLVYFGLILLPFWYRWTRAKERLEFFRHITEYTLIQSRNYPSKE